MKNILGKKKLEDLKKGEHICLDHLVRTLSANITNLSNANGKALDTKYITYVVHYIMRESLGKQYNQSKINEIIGAVETAKMDFHKNYDEE